MRIMPAKAWTGTVDPTNSDTSHPFERVPTSVGTQLDLTGPQSATPYPNAAEPPSATQSSDGLASPREVRFGRRALLTSGLAGLGIGAALGVGGTLTAAALRGSGDTASGGMGGAAMPADGVSSATDSANSTGTAPNLGGFGGDIVPCHGPHQAGITTAPAAHIRYVAYNLKPEVDHSALKRMFRLITGDIEGLTSGAAALADPEPELAARPARLTITVGAGRGLVDRIAGLSAPEWLGPLPTFSKDELGHGFDGGDLLVLLQADDPLPIAHAHRVLQQDLAAFATLRWQQSGFRQARGSETDGTTMRNMMGQVDGTVNPAPGDEGFDQLIWLGTESGAFAGGSAFVLRRIRMELDTWAMVDRPGREASIGRTLADGAPLTGGTEHTPADFEAVDPLGFTVIAQTAHIRRAHSTDPNERVFRRAVNYDDGVEAGLLFGCYQRDPLTQFVPIQRRLDEVDMLNTWITHTGSAVFAMLPGFTPGEMLGRSLFA